MKESEDLTARVFALVLTLRGRCSTAPIAGCYEVLRTAVRVGAGGNKVQLYSTAYMYTLAETIRRFTTRSLLYSTIIHVVLSLIYILLLLLKDKIPLFLQISAKFSNLSWPL